MIGKTIGSYTVLGQLGAGAMGEVYLAEHRHLKRKAALKLLSREIVDRPDLLERFFLEARATSAIAHPGIVQIFDCEVEATGRPYIVMEYLTGETLAATLARRGALPAVTVARMARGMAEALEAAHAKGIVHRDLKPENIFVEAEPPDAIKLVDFGIAKLAGDFQAGQVHKTRSGSLLGTPLYMSPEQCRDSANIDYRTDIYSLGCVIYEMLTRRPPFVYDALGDLVVAHMTEAPQSVRTVNPSVPEALAELVAELLRKDPAARPLSMRAVADRLAGFLARATTVPETVSGGAITPSSTASGIRPAPVGKAATTFGDSASELEIPGQPRGRRPIVIGVTVAVVAMVGGGLFASRLGGDRGAEPVVAAASPERPAATPAVAAPPAAAASPAVAAAPRAASVQASPQKPTNEPTNEPTGRTKTGREKRRLASATGATPAATTERAPAPPANVTPTEPPAAEPARAKPAPGFAGSWEGPWNDPEKHQKGRFALQVGPDGAVAGWMANAAAHQTFRMMGRLTPAGALDLACQCPANQSFFARGSVRADEDGELKGQLTLSNGAGSFGQSHLSLKRR